MKGNTTARLWSSLLAGMALFGGVIPSSHAVVVSTTIGNTSAPADDFGFNHIGKRNTTTAVYVGYGWMLTAAHVGPGSVILNGVDYDYVPGSARTLLDPMGTTTYADLTLFEVRDQNQLTPRMAPLTISATRPSVHALVTMVGQGLDRDPNTYGWHVSGAYPGEGTWIWSESYPLPLYDTNELRGFKMLSSRQIRWGTNKVYDYLAQPLLDISGKATMLMKTSFDEDGTPYESQVVAGDSGGGVFYKRDLGGDRFQWELAGIIHFTSQTYPNEPGGTLMLTHSVGNTYGMYSYSSDLAVYRDQILDIITPLPGDASLDGLVNDNDASILAAHWRMASGALWEDGDFNADGRVDDRDVAIMAAHWLEGAEQGPTTVPEPAILVLLAGAATTLLLRRMGTRRLSRFRVTPPATRRRASRR
ncbi:MAG: hypothetical protein NTW96_09815 [Planctomycetia bacterium]|nr:hypothetical protein [Planctomycetia bacterium]